MPFQPQEPGLGRPRGPASSWLALLATMALLAFLGLGAAIWVGGAQLDQAAHESEEGLVHLALSDVLHTLAQNTRDYCYWDEAAEAAVITNDTGWIDRNIGPLLYDSWGTEYVLVVEPDGRTPYALVDGERVDTTAEAALGPDLFRIMAGASVADGVPVPATGIVRWGDSLIAIAAAPFQPYDDFDLLAHPDFRPVHLVVGQRIDDTLLASLKDEYGLADPRLALDGLRAGEHGTAMLSPTGATVGQIAWRPDLPGSRQVKAVAPAVALLGLLFLGFSAFAFRNIHRSMRELGASNRALNEKVEEQRRLTDELRVARDAAEAGNRAKSEFLATISHEIRTPMNGILGMTGLLLDGELASPQRRFANTIQTSAEALLEIINDILDFSKIEARGLDLEEGPFDLEALVGGVTDLFAAKLQDGPVALTHRVAPSAVGSYLGDANRLRQILVNLVGNAVKFTGQGGIVVTASVASEGGPNVALRFSVSDTGIGIPEARRPHLFTMFTQGDASTSRRYGGTGLGLAICKRIVERMGGEIGFESREGEGSTFWFVVPLPRAAFRAIPSAATAPAPAAEHGADLGARPSVQRGLRVLVAEDNAINQEVAIGLLARLGHHAEVAADGREALAMVEASTYDLVLMDVQMPRMDGVEATRAIRAMPPPRNVLPVVALTANAMHGDRESFLAAGMDDYLTKPINAALLGEMLDRWGRRSSTAQGGSAADAAGSELAPAGLEAPVVDPEVELDLRQGLGAEVYERLVASFVARLEGAPGALRAWLDRGDLDAAQRDVHGLAGEANNLGFARLGARLGDLERACGQGAAATPASLARIEEAVAEVVASRGGAPKGMAA